MKAQNMRAVAAQAKLGAELMSAREEVEAERDAARQREASIIQDSEARAAAMRAREAVLLEETRAREESIRAQVSEEKAAAARAVAAEKEAAAAEREAQLWLWRC
jgi:hypothetical protein